VEVVVRWAPALMAMVAVSSLLTSPVYAAQVPWGFRAGWSGAHLQGSFGSDLAPDFRHDLTASFYARLGLGSGFGFQPELALVTKGGKGDLRITISGSGGTQAFDYHIDHRITYLEAPLLMRFEVPAWRSVGPYLLAGPSPALRVGDPATRVSFTQASPNTRARPAKATAQIFEDVGTLDDPLRTKAFDLGLVGGAGFSLGRGHARLGIDARYTQGVLDTHPSGHAESRNAAFAITTAIEFR
jgi:hypothetical protein